MRPEFAGAKPRPRIQPNESAPKGSLGWSVHIPLGPLRRLARYPIGLTHPACAGERIMR